MCYVILLWHSLSLPYNYFGFNNVVHVLYDGYLYLVQLIKVIKVSDNLSGGIVYLVRCMCSLSYYLFWF